jgi:CheY-like chemotaxis protein
MDDSDHFPGLDILIAEDNLDGAESLARILEAEGHAVRVVYDGGAAVAAALVRPPDVALLDIGLPRLDGWEVARRLRQGLGQRPCLIIAVTAYGQDADRLRSREAGIDFHLTKPLDANELVNLFREHALGLAPA